MEDITLKDVEIALKILNKFLEKQREAYILMRRLGYFARGAERMPMSFEDFIKMTYSTIRTQQTTSEKPPEIEITEEEVKQFKELAKKIREGEATSNR